MAESSPTVRGLFAFCDGTAPTPDSLLKKGTDPWESAFSPQIETCVRGSVPVFNRLLPEIAPVKRYPSASRFRRAAGLLPTILLAVTQATPLAAADAIAIWPNERGPGDATQLEAERDTTKPTDQLIAGKRVARIGNVSVPTIEVFSPPAEKSTGAAVLICPGGGHHILAYDLEGTEVAEWLNTIGVTGIVLKYRVPFRNPENRSQAAVQDAQRAMSLVRSRAGDWKIDKERIGILGFSAGGEAAARAALAEARTYERQDDVDDVSPRPDFAVLVYAAGLITKERDKLRDDVRVTEKAPPMFLAHAFDDGARIENSLLLYLRLKQVGVPAELHAYASGGHGFGLRRTDEPCTGWPERCAEWMRGRKIVP
ncbi:MAG: xylanase [Planctomycetota bacterium]|nr:MAG: xylanase [Planctomycetota bacterium]